MIGDMESILSFAVFAFGATLASFIGVIAERLNTGESWIQDRSRCNSCARTLATLDLIPVVSWLVVHGRCRTCKSRVPAGYFISEVVLGTVFLAGFLAFGLSLALLTFAITAAILLFVVLYDLRHTLVPRFAAALLTIAAAAHAVVVAPSTFALAHTFALAAGIGLFFFLLHALSRGRAMGLGDTPISFALALMVGAERALPGLLFSFWIGALVGIVILVSRPKGHRMGIEIPFVPFLAIGFLLAYFTTWNPLPFIL